MVRGHARSDTLNEMYLRSLEFLLGYQRVVLQARSYPFRVVETSHQQGTVTIEFDEEADAERRHGNPMLAAYALDERRRPRFADFLTALDSEREGRATLLNVVRRGSTREPYFGGTGVTVAFREYVDPYTVKVTVQGAGSIPKNGWIRHVDDGGSGPQLDRQERGLALLRAQPLLIESLREPFSFDLGRGRWIDTHPQEGEVDFDAASRKLIERILGTHPLFAMQGPPGSGKSTLTAAAVRRNLGRGAGGPDPGHLAVQPHPRRPGSQAHPAARPAHPHPARDPRGEGERGTGRAGALAHAHPPDQIGAGRLDPAAQGQARPQTLRASALRRRPVPP